MRWTWSRAKLGLTETLWHFNKVSQALGVGSEVFHFLFSWIREKWHKSHVILTESQMEAGGKLKKERSGVIYNHLLVGPMPVRSFYYYIRTKCGSWGWVGINRPFYGCSEQPSNQLRPDTRRQRSNTDFRKLLCNPEQCIRDATVWLIKSNCQ